MAVPVWKLAGDHRPARFGWHMYSRFTSPVLYIAVAGDGGADTVRTADHVVRLRSEIEFTHLLPQHLCAVLPGTQAVIVKAGRTTEHRPCR